MAAREFLASIRPGDVLRGTAATQDRLGTAVLLDGFSARPLGLVGSLDESWRRWGSLTAGQRITAEVLSVDLGECRVWLSTAATENPELWAFLKSRRVGEILSGTVASIHSFGVFVALDDGPAHPVFSGVGFVTHPDLSWRHFDAVTEIVQVGQPVSGEFRQFDTTNGEARMSLKALEPNPFDDLVVGQEHRGVVARVTPVGVFVRIVDGIAGLLRFDELTAVPSIGDEIAVVVCGIDRARVRLRPTASSGSPGG